MTFPLHVSLTQIGGPLILSLISLVLYFFEPLSFEWFAFSRNAVENMELWRIFTTNLIHTNGYHLLFNIGGMAVLWGVHAHHYTIGKFLVITSLIGIFSSLAIFYFAPHYEYYTGLSAICYGMFMWGSYMDIKIGMRSGWLLLIGGTVKITYDVIHGGSEDVASLIESSVAVESHLYGAIAATCIFGLMWIRSAATHSARNPRTS